MDYESLNRNKDEEKEKKKKKIIIIIIIIILLLLLWCFFIRNNDAEDPNGNGENFVQNDTTVSNSTNTTEIEEETSLSYEEVDLKVQQGKELYSSNGTIDTEGFFQWLEDEKIINKKENNVVDKGNGVYEITTTDGYKIVVTIGNAESETTEETTETSETNSNNSTSSNKKPSFSVSGNIIFENLTWKNGKASVNITTTTGYNIEYQVNSATGSWSNLANGKKVEKLENGDILYARLSNGSNKGNYASIEIKDNTKPSITNIGTTTTTNSITVNVIAQDDETGLADTDTYTYYIKESKQADTKYVEKATTSDKTYTFTDLSDGTSYDIKVTVNDKVNNKGEGTLLNQTTGEVTDGTQQGTITFENLLWDGIDNASIEISTNTEFDIEYQVNSYEGNWSKYTKAITSLKHGDVVYARLTDGLNTGNYTSIDIKDTQKPVITKFEVTTTTSSIDINIEATDNETGVDIYKRYV